MAAIASADRYNNIVIGAGAAGLVTAYVTAALKARVALIERHKMGGDCLNFGCVPSKAIIRTAKLISDIKRHADFGIKSAKYEIDFAEVMARVHRIIKAIEPHDSVERYTGLGVDCIQGNAEILDPHHVRVGGRTLRGRSIILGLGASPFVPPISGLKDVKYRTSENLWEMTTLPKRMIVLGGGPIGCEMAQTFQRLGSSVSLVELAPRLLVREDPDVSEEVEKKFKREGVTVLTKTKATEVRKQNGENVLVCTTATGQTVVPFDELLIAVGRKANTGGFDWAKLGIELNPNGTFKVDEYLRTTQPNIYAAGDCAGPYQFTHTASHQAGYCAINSLIAPFWKLKADYRVIPAVTFTDPEVATVGINQTTAEAQNIPHRVTTYDIDDLDRAICDGSDYGFVKVLTEPKSDKVLGATIVGVNAGELLTEFTAAMHGKRGLGAIMGAIHPYPTMSEANKYVAGVWKRSTAPQGALKILKVFHSWRR